MKFKLAVIFSISLIFTDSCKKEILPEIILPDGVPIWTELLGSWDIDETVSPNTSNNGTVSQYVLVRKDMKADTRWTEMSVEFKINAQVSINSIGFALNVIDSENFGIIGINFNSFRAGLWKNKYYCPWMNVKIEPIQPDKWYSFAKQLRKKLNVPIGIIGSYWGGTSAESWLPREVLASDPITKTILDQYLSAQNSLNSGTPISSDVNPFNIPDQSHAPGYLYNGMIYPHIPFAISGVIWYQGESNTLRAEQYETLFPMLINSWRDAWNKPEMNFLFVQLAGYDGKLSGNNIVNAWPHIREGQRLTLNKIENTGMAVAIDLGDISNIHPIYKRELGERLARLALHDVYRYKNIVRCGPLYESVVFEGNSANVSFSETNLSLQIRDGDILQGFVFAGSDRHFYKASAEINADGKSVRIWSDNIGSPVAVRYAWENYPVNANLINNADLPASPFRTDNWPLY